MNRQNPVISIAIPTYNRVSLLRTCLDSIVCQFKDPIIARSVEIIISDNASTDKTEETVKKYIRKYRVIRYNRNKHNIGGDPNLYKAASLTKGDYIWFFSDDDMYNKDSLKTVIKVIKTNKPDVIIPNMDLYEKDGVRLIDRNLLRNKKDIYVKTKKDYFKYLEGKFFLPFDWHIGVYSNTIVNRNLYFSNVKKVYKYEGFLNPFNQVLFNPFTHSAIFYYFPDDHKIYMIAKSLIKYRDNRTFGKTANQADFLRQWYSILDKHYKIIWSVNNKNISLKFKILITLKMLIRNLRLLVIQYIKFDIAEILMKLFHKDAKGKRRKWSIPV